MTTISKYDDLIDSRDIIERIEELENEREENGATWGPDEAAELFALQKLADEAEGYSPDWRYGETLIRDSYFVTYAQELADELGAIDDAATWPNYCIDWEQAARELQVDYTAVDFDGVTYWIR